MVWISLNGLGNKKQTKIKAAIGYQKPNNNPPKVT
jgi:hypothetical protein